MKPHYNPWPSLFFLGLGCAALSWYSPVAVDEASTRKVQMAAAISNWVFEPLIGLVGKDVLVAFFGVVAIYGLLRMFHLDLSILSPVRDLFSGLGDSMRQRASRKDELEGDSATDLTEPPRNMAAVFGRARGEPLLATAGASLGAEPPTPKEYAPHPLGVEADIQYLAACFQFEENYSRADMERRYRELHGDDRPLTNDLHTRVTALIDEWNRRLTAPEERPAPIAIVRKAREDAGDWDGATSWLGGAPCLGDAAWPRGKDGKPLPFVAQLDCADLTRACPESCLPTAGSLAFFINDGAVLYVPPGEHGETPPPDDLQQAYVPLSYPLPEKPNRAGKQLFPRWPVDCLRMELPDGLPPHSDSYDDSETIWQAQGAAVRALVPQSKEDFEAPQDETLWWRAAQLFSQQLFQAHGEIDRLIASCRKYGSPAKKLTEAQLAEGMIQYASKADQVEAQAAPLFQFAKQVEAFAAQRDPWERMTDEEADVLKDALRAARDQFEDIVRYHVPHSLRDLRSVCHKEMMAGDERMFAQLPQSVVDRFNHCRRLPRNGHQVFGLGSCIQTNLYDHICDHLLLQIAYDEMAEMKFGDVGIFQYWISPEAMAAGEWDKAELTFECH